MSNELDIFIKYACEFRVYFRWIESKCIGGFCVCFANIFYCCAYIFSTFSLLSLVFLHPSSFHSSTILVFVFIISWTLLLLLPPCIFIIFFELLSNFLHPSHSLHRLPIYSTFSHFHKLLFALTVYRLCDISLVHQ